MAGELTLLSEECMALDTGLEPGERTARVQVIVSYADETGNEYVCERIIKVRLKRVKKEDQ